jgi:hypothetical protein
MNNAALLQLLQIIAIASEVAKPIATSAGGELGLSIDVAAGALAEIISKAMAAHIAITGEPIDLDKLQPIAPVE